VERVPYLNSCHPRGSGGPGQQTRSCKRKGHDTRYIWHGALGPRFRGDDNGGSGDKGKGGGDDGLLMKRPLLSNLMIFPASAGVTEMGKRE